MTFNDTEHIYSLFSSFHECQFQLSDWIHGTNSLSEMEAIISRQLKTLHQLNLWKDQGLIFPKPTLGLRYTFVFWADKSILDSVLSLDNVQGGFQVQNASHKLPDSSSYKGKKRSPRPRRVLLDIGCESHVLINSLKKIGLEVVSLWDYVSDLLHYEIIELCTTQYIDLLVTSNEKLLLPREEWLDYLMPHRTRMLIIPQRKLDFPEDIAGSIHHYSYVKRKFKTKNQLFSISNTINKSNQIIGGEKNG